MRIPIACILLLTLRAAAFAGTSQLWGEQGEKWSDTSRLPDFSFAGYHCGEVPLPELAQTASVEDFGAKGDGVTDDTKAFTDAITATKEGAIFIPEGRYVLTDVIPITRSHLILRGAGPDKTVLVIPKSLQQIQDAKSTEGAAKTNFSFQGGFIAVTGRIEAETLADVAVAAHRGDRTLTLSARHDLKPGTFIRLLMRDADHTLGKHLHSEQADAGEDTYNALKNKDWIDWAARIVKVEGNQLTLDRPLRLDVRLEWLPRIASYQPTVSEVGIENLSFQFPGIAKKPHLHEEGFNAIQIYGGADCWVRNVTITDADNGIILNGGSRFCTITGVRFRAEKRTGRTGHHALWITGTQDSMAVDFHFETTYIHDLTVEGRANGNVFRNGGGVSMNFDHHRNAPYENLFTNLDVGNPRRVWESSGREDRGPHTGARETFWNIHASDPHERWPPTPDWPEINIVGLPQYEELLTSTEFWIEPIADIQPPDLYEAQLERRLTMKPNQ